MSPTPVLTPGAPADVDLSASALEGAAGLLTAALDAGRISAASLTVARHGRLVLSRGFGNQRPEPGARPVDAESIFLLASITKPVTACAVMLLVDRGLWPVALGTAALGLALVAQQADLHGGTATLEASPLGGARLLLRLPGPR